MIISQSPTKQHHKKMLYQQELTYLQILPHHQLEQNPDVLRNHISLVKYLLIKQIEFFYKQINWVEQIQLFFKQANKQINKQTNRKRLGNSNFWPTCEVAKLKEGDVILSTSLLTFHFISFSPNLSDHVLFSFPSANSPSHSFHLPQSISIIFTFFGCIHITWSFNLIISFTFQPIPSLEINDLWVSLDKFYFIKSLFRSNVVFSQRHGNIKVEPRPHPPLSTFEAFTEWR